MTKCGCSRCRRERWQGITDALQGLRFVAIGHGITVLSREPEMTLPSPQLQVSYAGLAGQWLGMAFDGAYS